MFPTPRPRVAPYSPSHARNTTLFHSFSHRTRTSAPTLGIRIHTHIRAVHPPVGLSSTAARTDIHAGRAHVGTAAPAWAPGRDRRRGAGARPDVQVRAGQGCRGGKGEERKGREEKRRRDPRERSPVRAAWVCAGQPTCAPKLSFSLRTGTGTGTARSSGNGAPQSQTCLERAGRRRYRALPFV